MKKYVFRPYSQIFPELFQKEQKRIRSAVNLTYPENNEWTEFLEFRDYLKSHPKESDEYSELKRQAALEANDDGKKYRKIKEPIFKKIKESSG